MTNQMPFLLPRSISSGKIALVLAYGNLSNLELCSLNREGISAMETPGERISVITSSPHSISWIARVAGVHKAAPIIDIGKGDFRPTELVKTIAENFDSVPTLSVSTYDFEDDEHEFIVRTILDEFRNAGFRKTHLLRPKGNELRAEDVLARKALDVIALHYQGGYGLGPTAWVPDSLSFRERGLMKPKRLSEISMSPRLASLLVNLTGLTRGQTILDPFCGSGTILAEALLRGYRCLGLDSSERMVRYARRNLGWIASGMHGAEFEVSQGDARELSQAIGGSKVDAVVTEPLLIPALTARPRMQTAAELIERAGEVYANALASIADVVSPGGRIVMVVPVLLTMEGKEMSLALKGRILGLRPYQPGPLRYDYPVRPSFESTRWVRRGVYVFETGS
jgi:tRNA G10  N-methylase Trm11